MRIALLSPYSWTYPGGVTRHIEALAERLLAGGHDVSVLAPFDPDDSLAARLHGGARPQARALPEYLKPLGRTAGLRMNGAMSNLALTPTCVMRLRHELRNGGYDVVHLHEPIAPIVSWDALGVCRTPMVGTFHCYSKSLIANHAATFMGARRRLNRLGVRIAVSEAAAWTNRRFFGGRYRVIPNGVDLPDTPLAPLPPADELRLVFVGQAVERKGLPVLLRAFEALREHIPVRLTIVGADADQVTPLLLDAQGVEIVGKVDDAHKQRLVHEADVLCAPSLGGESFGMVLTEAFAAGTPVVASDIAGYRDVVSHGENGLLVQRGDAAGLAEALRDLWEAPGRRAELAAGAEASAQRFAWQHVAEEVSEAYEDALAIPEPSGVVRRAATRVGALPADGQARVRARRLPSLEPAPAAGHSAAHALIRKVGLVIAAVVGVALTVLALNRIGIHNIVLSLLQSTPGWVVAALAVMCGAMVMRALSWHAILRAALPRARIRRRDAAQGTFIGVLMSATLPARLGEPSRAFVVARRIGRIRESFPIVLGTLVSQTLLNIVALGALGAVMLSSIGVFSGRSQALLLWGVAPLALVIVVIVAPALLRGGSAVRSARLRRLVTQARSALVQVRLGLRVFRQPRLGAQATLAQFAAWAMQWMSCYLLLIALGLDSRVGIGGAAAVLFAVNVTAVLPVTPSNLGVFQAACVAVLSGAYGISEADGLGYGIILQAVEIATAVVMGMPALLKEGLSWRDVRLRAMHSTPVRLPARRRGEAPARSRA